MALDTFVLVAAQYDNSDDALADYDAVHDDLQRARHHRHL